VSTKARLKNTCQESSIKFSTSQEEQIPEFNRTQQQKPPPPFFRKEKETSEAQQSNRNLVQKSWVSVRICQKQTNKYSSKSSLGLTVVGMVPRMTVVSARFRFGVMECHGRFLLYFNYCQFGKVGFFQYVYFTYW